MRPPQWRWPALSDYMKTIKLYTLGCKANQYDTQAIRERFLSCGFKELCDGRKADLHIINTCTVTHRADAESLSLLRRVKRENPRARIVVTGCLTELDRDRIHGIDKNAVIARNREKGSIVRLVDGIGDTDRRNGFRGISFFEGHSRAFLKIQDGCNNYCSYCKVPFVRGKSVSKPLPEIIAEARRLAENSYKEIVLTGICLGSYGRDLKKKASLVEVVEALQGIDALVRIRLSSIEPQDISDALITLMAKSKKLCRHLHIPLQSGDRGVLAEMHRGYTPDAYLDLIAKIRRQVPGIAITTDVVAGFPGETEDNFLNTVKVIKKIVPLKVHIFPYSKREGTYAAAHYEEGISPLVIRKRVIFLRQVADLCCRQYRKRFLQKKMTVLIEGCSKDAAGFGEGYTDNYIKTLVRVPKALPAALVYVRLKRIEGDAVVASFC